MEENKTEKKKFNKKYLAFGIVGILALMVVSAAVYTYISNTATVNVEVNAPMQVYLDGDTSKTSLDVSVTTADPISFTIYEKSLASNPIEMYNVLLDITSTTELSGAEFTSIYLTDNVGHTNMDVLPYVKYIKADGTYAAFSSIGSESPKLKTAKLMMASNGVTLDKFTMTAGNLHTSALTINNALGATGDYTIKVCDIYNLIGATCA
jgi:hypothetical protein